MYDDVLLPTDGSEAVEAALDHGLRIAENDGATVHALSVVDQRLVAAAGDDDRADVEARLVESAEDALDRVVERAELAGLEVVRERRRGTPEKEILAYAEEAGADLIAIASHGKTAREKVTSLGSVSERVVDGAAVPVLVVREEG